MAGSSPEILTSASSMELLRVQTADGRFLGRVFDIRCEWLAGREEPVVTDIIFGKRGLLERIGMRQVVSRKVTWEKVQAIYGNLIIVDHR
jgi:sporulation protein YlmC with PRC-barrel domain